jgi:hypothetical protein
MMIHIPEGDPNRPVRRITWKEANEAQRRREGKIALETFRARARRGGITEKGVAYYTRFQRLLASSVEGVGAGLGWIFQWPKKARLGERL